MTGGHVMIKMINRRTGTVMMVAEDRVSDYQKNGHVLADPRGEVPAADPPNPAKPVKKRGSKK